MLTAEMVATIKLILQLSFLFTTPSFTGSSDPSLDLNCLTDYHSKMTCHLNSKKLTDCSQYELNMIVDSKPSVMHNCSFEEISAGECECTLTVPGFVLLEILNTTVLRKKKMVLTRQNVTADIIKPKRPTIRSIVPTENGNFLVSWDTNYTPIQKTFSSSLIPELTYSAQDGKEVTVHLGRGVLKYEIVGRNLHASSVYTIKVRVRWEPRERFSEYSKPHHFTTPSSLRSVLGNVVPVLCVMAVVCAVLIFCWYQSIMRTWKNIPIPTINSDFVKQEPKTFSVHNDFSPVCVDHPKLAHSAEKRRIESLEDLVKTESQSPAENVYLNDEQYTHVGLHDFEESTDPGDQSGSSHVPSASYSQFGHGNTLVPVHTEMYNPDYGNIQSCTELSSFSRKLVDVLASDTEGPVPADGEYQEFPGLVIRSV